MKVVIVVVLVSIFSFGFWWFGKHSLQDIQVKEASLISKVEYLKHSIHKKEVEVARLQIVIKYSKFSIITKIILQTFYNALTL